MPVKRIEASDALILLAPIGEAGGPESRLADSTLTASDREYISRLQSPKRRAEAAAWRAAVRGEGVSGEIGYDRCGAPVLPANPMWRHIGVAHTTGMAAVILSRQPCAIDIERTDRDFCRASSKFISAEEARVPGSDNPLFPAAVWCAKEALYKLSGRTGLDFLADLRIATVDFGIGVATAGIRSEVGGWRCHSLKILFEQDYLLIYMTGNDCL